jgi:hypothetical protein
VGNWKPGKPKSTDMGIFPPMDALVLEGEIAAEGLEICDYWNTRTTNN